MQEIVFLEQSRKVLASFFSLSGYVVGATVLGMILDNKFFNNGGLCVVISFLIGLALFIISFVRVVFNNEDD